MPILTGRIQEINIGNMTIQKIRAYARMRKPIMKGCLMTYGVDTKFCMQ